MIALKIFSIVITIVVVCEAKTKLHRYQKTPLKLYELVEGDIRQAKHSKRNAVVNKGLLWPGGIVPYSISTKYNSASRDLFENAMRTIEEATSVQGQKCVQFMPRTTEENYVLVKQSGGCWSDLGRKGKGEQTISIDTECGRKGTVMHELLHTLGFFHEQSRADRDHYVDIHYDNIQEGAERNFEKYAIGTIVDHLNQPYDYDSIMHYQSTSFAKNRNFPTITAKNKLTHGVIMGQRDHLSVIDVKMIRLLYGCQINEDQIETEQCKDKLDNCKLYGEYACRELPEWAAKNCARTCGICEPVCEDKLSNCAENGDEICEDILWAEEHCAKTCEVGHCRVERVEPDCGDIIPDCAGYGKETCSTYRVWASERCPHFCGFCVSEASSPVMAMTSAPKPTTTLPATTRGRIVIANVECVDRINNCEGYGKGYCSGKYGSFMIPRCSKFCGFCTSLDQEACTDVSTNCLEYGKSQCGGEYTTYMRQNCASYCDYC